MCMCHCGVMSTIYCYVRNESTGRSRQSDSTSVKFKKKEKNSGKHSTLCVCLYLENTWKDTHQIVSVSLGSGFKRGE